MSEFYDDLAETALELLTEFGFVALLKVKPHAVAGKYDPATGKPATSAPIVENRNVVVTDAPGNRLAQQYGNTTHEGTLVQQTEKWVYMDANGSVPKMEDTVEMQGVSYTILDTQVIAPGGQPLLYILVLRK